MSPCKIVYAKDKEDVKRIVKPVVEATTVGFIPSSRSKGLITIPPPIPNIPAKVPAIIDIKLIYIEEEGSILYSVG